MIGFADSGFESDDLDLKSTVDSVFKSGGPSKQFLVLSTVRSNIRWHNPCDSLLDGKHLLFEAGTGVGKSLAYLLPSIFFAMHFQRPCVVATNTISLQEQLLNKDIPSVRTLFESVLNLNKFKDFRCALLVGRANYLCTTRLHRSLSGQVNSLKENREENWRESQSGLQPMPWGIRQNCLHYQWEQFGMLSVLIHLFVPPKM